jgi:DNA-binding transcriptional regulator YdaS (Cro superfamily)
LISMYASGARLIPVGRCLQIERVTGVRAEWLRPDVSFKRRRS